MSVSLWGGRCARCPVCPGAHRLRPRRVVLLPCRWAGACWSGWCSQDAEPLPAGQERPRSGAVGVDGEGLLAGVGGDSRGEVPDPVAEGVRVGVAEFGLVGVAEEPD